MSVGKSLLHRYRKRFRSRWAADFEWHFRYPDDGQELHITFFAERRPLVFELSYLTGDTLEVESLSFEVEGELQRQQHRVREQRRERVLQLSVEPVDTIPVRKVVIRLASSASDLDGRLRVLVTGDYPPDFLIVADAMHLVEAGRFEAATERLHEYEEYSTRNPLICYWLADWYREQGQIDVAEEYAGKSLAQGEFEACSELYRRVQAAREPRPLTEIRPLQEEARRWSVGGHHGAILLEREQRYLLGLSGCTVRKRHETIEIRRPVAARKLTQLGFPFSAGREAILHTGLRVVHRNDEVEEVSLEQFAIADDTRRNALILIEDEKLGHWILPDLVSGDVIEWSVDLLHRDRIVEERSQVFFLDAPFHDFFPTFRGRLIYRTATEAPVRFAVRNVEQEVVRQAGGHRPEYVFEGSRFIPARGSGFVHENHLLNPVVACASDGVTWQQAVREALRANFGDADLSESLPQPFAGFVQADDAGSPALERSFYWLRDKLKYASVLSGLKHIGAADRGRRILDSGVGDCKDKSYLLALVCRALEIPFEFVVISTRNGTLIEEMPADQFDHVLVRVSQNGRWSYLDAASPLATFGSTPTWCQGMQALVLNDDAEIIRIPEDAPETNVFEIAEIFGERDAGRISGKFDLLVQGPIARVMDEAWKSISLSLDDQRQAGQEALSDFLPATIIDECERGKDTSESDTLQVEGLHSRGPLVTLDRRRAVICTMSWGMPSLPIREWRGLQLDRLWVAHMPMQMVISATFEGPMRHAIEDISNLEPLDNQVARVMEELSESADRLTVRRTVQIKKRFCRGDEVRQAKEAFDRIESAFQLVIAFDPARL